MEKKYLYKTITTLIYKDCYDNPIVTECHIISSDSNLKSDSYPERKFLKYSISQGEDFAVIKQYENLGEITDQEIETLKKFKIIEQ